MARRQDDSPLDQLFELLKLTPVWVGPVLAVLAFVLPRYPRLDRPRFLREEGQAYMRVRRPLEQHIRDPGASSTDRRRWS